MSDVRPDLAAEGFELLEPGNLYTIGRLAVVCLKHEPGHRPHLKLKPYPASFIESVARLIDGVPGGPRFITPEMAKAEAGQ